MVGTDIATAPMTASVALAAFTEPRTYGVPVRASRTDEAPQLHLSEGLVGRLGADGCWLEGSVEAA